MAVKPKMETIKKMANIICLSLRPFLIKVNTYFKIL